MNTNESILEKRLTKKEIKLLYKTQCAVDLLLKPWFGLCGIGIPEVVKKKYNNLFDDDPFLSNERFLYCHTVLVMDHSLRVEAYRGKYYYIVENDLATFKEMCFLDESRDPHTIAFFNNFRPLTKVENYYFKKAGIYEHQLIKEEDYPKKLPFRLPKINY